MAGKQREVSMVITAKEKSAKAIEASAEALRDLNKAQAETGKEAQTTGGLLARLQGAFKGLDSELKGLDALNKVAANMKKATSAVGELDARFRESTAEQSRLQAAQNKAAETTAELAAAANTAKAAFEAQRKVVNELTAEQKKDVAATEEARKSRDELKLSMQAANTALNVAARGEQELADRVVSVTRVVEAQSMALTEAHGELMELSAIANKASLALGGVEATQEGVARASAKATEDMKKLNAAMSQTSRTGGGQQALPSSASGITATYRAQIQAVQDAKSAWDAAKREANELGRAMKNVESPTRDMQTAFVLSQKASKDAKAEYLAQGQALNHLRGEISNVRKASTPPIPPIVAPDAPAVITATGRAARTAASETAKMGSAFSSVYGESRKAMSLFQRVRGEVLSLASAYLGLYAAIEGIGSVISTAIQYQATQTKLSVVFGDNIARIQTEMTYLEEESNRLGVSFNYLAGNYADFAIASKDANLSGEETRKVFKSIAESGVALNVSTEDMQGIFKALTQIMSKGKVQAEELRGQLGDRMTGAFRLMADAVGVTTAELDDMLKKGEVIADRSTLIAFADTVTEKYGDALPKALKGLNAEIGRFGNNMVQAQKQVGEGGFVDEFTTSLRELNEWFQTDDARQFFEGIGVALGKVVSLLPPLVQNFGYFTTALQIFAGFKAAEILKGLAGGIGGVRLQSAAAVKDVTLLTYSLGLMGNASTGVAARALTGLSGALVTFRGVAIAGASAARALWTAIGGLPGLIITVATTALTMFAGDWLTSVDKATEAINEHETLLRKLQSAYSETGKAARAAGEDIASATATELQANTIQLAKEWDKLAQEMLRFSGVEIDGNLDPQVRNLIRLFADGKISASDFRAKLDEIAQANPNLDRTFTAQLIKMAEQLAVVQRAVETNNAGMARLGNVATDAQNALLGLSNEVANLNGQLNAGAVEDYANALDAIGKFIPKIKAATEAEGDIKTITDAYFKGVEQAIGDPAKIAELNSKFQQAKAEILKPKKTGGRGGGRKKSPADVQKDFNDELERANALRAFEITQIERSTRAQEIEKAVFDARAKAKSDKAVFSADQEKALRASVAAEYDAKAAAEATKQIARERLELAKELGVLEGKEAYIAREAKQDKIDLLTAEGKEYEKIKGQLYDITAKEIERKKVQEKTSNLESQSRSIQEQIQTAETLGDQPAVEALRQQLLAVNAELVKAIDLEIAWWRAQDPVTNPQIASAVAGLEAQRVAVQAIGNQAITTGRAINDSLAGGLTNAFDQFAQKIAEGKGAIKSFWEAFVQFAADFLRQIALMIIQAIILKALTGDATGGGKGIGGWIADKINGKKSVATKHTGGIVGGAGGGRKSVYSEAFTNAVRYHTGGVVGLAPNEIPIIAKKNEEVLTESDPRHRNNMGAAGAKVDVKNVILMNPLDMLKYALADTAGQKLLVTTIGDNSRAINGALAR